MSSKCAGCGQLFYDWALEGQLCRLCKQLPGFSIKPLEHGNPFLLIRKGKRVFFYGRLNDKPVLMSVEIPKQKELSVRVLISNRGRSHDSPTR